MTVLAHIGGMPVEEALPSAIALALALRVWAARVRLTARARSTAGTTSNSRHPCG